MIPLKDSLKGRVALVTGAGSGIGKATAKMLAYTGARVAALDRTEEELCKTISDIRSHGGEALELAADISDPIAMEKAYAKLQATWGALDVVVANAGVNGVWAPLERIELADWDHTLGINLRGTFLTLKYAIPMLKARRGGSIVVTASVNGTRIFSNTGTTAYACSKAAQVALVKMLAIEFGPHKIRINAICPGAVDTKIGDSTVDKDVESVRIRVDYPEGRIPLTHGVAGTSGQIAELIWFLASDYSNHITGSEIHVDGGQSLLQG